jgi:antitoxin component YwqK of YwqJK toxin-antitoxin module
MLFVLAGALAQGASANLPFEVDRVLMRWHPDGAPASVGYSLGGEKTGLHRSWDERGTLRWEASFANGVYEGEAREWYADGRLARVRRFRGGREAGLQQAWTPEGELFLNYEARDGRRYGLQNAQPCVPARGKETM